jgi:hypothetical protein
MSGRPPGQIVNLLESVSYRTFASLRSANRQLISANDSLRQMNEELLEENAELYRENLTLLLKLTRIGRRPTRPGC